MGENISNSEGKKLKLPFPCTEKFFQLAEIIKEKLFEDNDQVLGLFFGDSGSGKSNLLVKLCYLVSGEKFTLDKIAFNKDQYIYAVLSSKKECVVGDEGISLFHAKEAMRTEGVIMQQLIDQSRQQNLFLPICMVKALDTNQIIIDRLNFAVQVWESKEMIKDKEGKPVLNEKGKPRFKTIKGNYAIYPDFSKAGGKNYLIPLFNYLEKKKQQRKNPFITLPEPPESWARSGGQVYEEGEGGNHGFFPPTFTEAQYNEKKYSILGKYRNALKRKKRNTDIDFNTMDKLIRTHVKQADIAKYLDCSVSEVKIRSKLIKKGHKKNIKKHKHRGKKHSK
jgi:hypothetical protein